MLCLNDKQKRAINAMKNVGYVSTIGLLISDEKIKKPIMAKVSFDKKDDYVVAKVISALNLEPINRLGNVYLTRQQLRDMPEDAYDDSVFAKAAFKLFGIEI